MFESHPASMVSSLPQEIAMRPNTVFLSAGALALLFGLGFLMVPAALLPLYGVSTDGATVLMGRFFGAALAQLGLVLYLLRDVRDGLALRGLALAGVIGSVFGAVVALMGVLSGGTNALGWSTVAIYAVLGLGYAGLLRPRTATV
jgi:hypothetical protein